MRWGGIFVAFCVFAGYPSGAGAVEAPVGVALGAKTCGQAACHAASEPWPNSAVSQREYIVWKEKDPHSRAWLALESPLGRRIAWGAGLGEATEAKACRACHAYDPERKAPTFDIRDGVSCEACHGAASGWLGVHAAGLYFYGENVAKGMYPTADPAARAELCLGCHVGDENRFVTHRMMALGHPRLPFELNFYTWFRKDNPRDKEGYAHLVVDDDYLQRKPWPFGVKTWALGEVIQARMTLDLITDPRRAPRGMFPEFALFECVSCHRTPKAGQGGSLTIPRIKAANVLFAGFATELVDRALARRIRAGAETLRTSAAYGWRAVIDAARRLDRAVIEAESKLRRRNFTLQDTRRMLRRVTHAYRNGALSEYDDAEQAVLSVASLVDELTRRRVLAPAEAAAATEAMARAVTSFRAGGYSRNTVREAMNEIAGIVAD